MFRKLRNENEKRRRDIFNQLISNLGEIVFVDHSKESNEKEKCSKNEILRETFLFLKKEKKSFFVSTDLKCSSMIDEEIISYFNWKPSNKYLSNEQWFEMTIEVIELNLFCNRLFFFFFSH